MPRPYNENSSLNFIMFVIYFRKFIQNFETHSILNQRASPLKYQLIARDSIRRQPIILQAAKVNNKSNRGKLITNGWMFHLLVRFALCDRWSLKR